MQLHAQLEDFNESSKQNAGYRQSEGDFERKQKINTIETEQKSAASSTRDQ